MTLNEADQMMNESLANPHRASWSARSEVLHVLHIVRHLYDEDSEMVRDAELAYDLICRIDDGLE